MRPLPRRRDDEGVAIVTVVILVVVGFTVASVIAASTVFGVHQTTDDRSRLQALAAAEGGRDYALAQLISSACEPPSNGTSGQPGYSSTAGTEPAFTADVYFVQDADPIHDPAPDSTAGADPGCPAPVTPPAVSQPGFVGVSSTGTAEDGTTHKTVLAWYPWTNQEVPDGIVGAVVEGEGGSVEADVQNQEIYNSAGSLTGAPHNANVILRTTGGLKCTTAEINGDVVVTQAVPTDLGGSATVGSPLVLKNCTVHGNVYAYASIQLQNSTVIDGSVVSLDGTISGSGTIKGDAWAYGSITGVTVLGGSHADQGATIAVPNSMSGATTWKDYAFDSSAWSAGGWTHFAYLGSTRPAELPSTATQLVAGHNGCSFQSDSALQAAVNGLTGRWVIDTTGCPNSTGVSLKQANLSLKADVTLVVNNFTLDSATVQSSDGTTSHEFNLIQSDSNLSDTVPDCPDPTVQHSATNFTMASPIRGLLYSPCDIDFGGGTTTWSGQVFLEKITNQGNSAVYYTPVTDVPAATSIFGFAGGKTVSVLEPTRLGQTEP